MIAQVFIPNVELAIPIEHRLIKEMQKLKNNHLESKEKQEKVRSNSELNRHFYASHLFNNYVLLLLKDNFLFHLLF